jgi:glycosyltransferase involved in cell wall biosynthesis
MLWIDSLYLDALPELARAKSAGQRVGLLLHYLPSLLRVGDELGRDDLGDGERAALDLSDAFLVTSPFAAALLRRLGAGPRPILCVEPGRFANGLGELVPATPGTQAALVGNLAANKGVAPFLQALGQELAPGDRFALEIIGGDADSAYAATCRDIARQHELLAARVRFAGALSPEEVPERLRRKNLLISASVSEAYGMALAEGRTVGLPILARRGGNVENLVHSSAGGELVADEHELARAAIRLARDAEEHARRSALARREALAPRSWWAAAHDFMAQLAELRAYDQ